MSSSGSDHELRNRISASRLEFYPLSPWRLSALKRHPTRGSLLSGRDPGPTPGRRYQASVLSTRRRAGKVLVLCQNGDPVPNSVLPNLRVIRIVQPDFDDGESLMVSACKRLKPGGAGNQPNRELGRERGSRRAKTSSADGIPAPNCGLRGGILTEARKTGWEEKS